jgi:hypothetical protein
MRPGLSDGALCCVLSLFAENRKVIYENPARMCQYLSVLKVDWLSTWRCFNLPVSVTGYTPSGVCGIGACWYDTILRNGFTLFADVKWVYVCMPRKAGGRVKIEPLSTRMHSTM